MTAAQDHDAVLEAARRGLVYLPLGGAGEIGMNFYLYGCDGAWLAVECGVTFGDGTIPGIDVLMADPAFLETLGPSLIGLVLTHAHEDHQGALAHLWPRMRCPVYATPFTAGLVRRKLGERGLEDRVPLHELSSGSRIVLGPFSISLVSVTHSLPEPNALAIETPHGLVVHSGDWKLDPHPLIGPETEELRLRAFGDAGVLALVCDSTNVFVSGSSGSEATVREALVAEMGRHHGRVVVTCFASNIARVESIAHAAARAGREVALAGRSLWTLTELARDCGLLSETPRFLTEYDAGYLPPERLCLICTGSQGERGSALERVSRGDHPRLVLEKGDSVLFSSRRIPGNERAIYAMQDRLARLGVVIVTEKEVPNLHVSGHPAQEELARMYEWVRPDILVPMHGEARHLIAHADYARSLGIKAAPVVTNGEALRLAPGAPDIVGTVAHGRLGVDGNRLVSLESSAVRDRRQLTHAGTASLSVVLDRSGRLLAPPAVHFHGVIDAAEHATLADQVVREVMNDLEKAEDGTEGDDEALRHRLRLGVRRVVNRETGKRPVTTIHLSRVDAG